MDGGYGIWDQFCRAAESDAILDTPQYNELQAAVSPGGRWMA
jgi:hypothetical protein